MNSRVPDTILFFLVLLDFVALEEMMQNRLKTIKDFAKMPQRKCTRTKEKVRKPLKRNVLDIELEKYKEMVKKLKAF